ncbi:MAG: PxKF domain-containing protein [Caldilineaceae bacterium]
MPMIPFLRHHLQTPLSVHANHNHRRPWHGLRILALLLTFTLGLGLIQPVLAAPVWQIQTVDSAGIVGENSSLALDGNGNPVISYYDATNQDLKLVHCGDATCGSGNTIRTVDSVGDVGSYTSLALDSSGNPVISYYDRTNQDLKLVYCGDATCNSANIIRTVDSAGDVGESTSLELDSSGNPVISYFDHTHSALKLVHCGDATCGSGNVIQTLDGGVDSVGTDSSLALDSDGRPVISYYDDSNFDLKLVRCGDVACSSGNTIQIVDGPADVGSNSALALDSNGYPVISYYDESNINLKFVHCGDATCSSGNSFQTLDSTRYAGFYSSLTLDRNGNPVIAYLELTNQSLKLIHCGDATCSSGNILQSVDPIGDQPSSTSLALDSNGNPVISYYDFSSGALKLARLAGDDTPPVITANVVGALGNNDWYVSDVTVSWNVVDNESAVSAQSGCDPTVLTSDTLSITLTCTATSEGGSSSLPITLKLDQSAPFVAPVVSPNPVTLGGAATLSSGATDALSGLASESCGALDTSTVGVKSVTCTATDNAGNTASATINYTVAYPWSGFLQPVDNFPTVNTVNAGQGIPVKFSLGGEYGLNIFASGYPKVQVVSCGGGSGGSSDPIEETVTAGNSSLQYDPGSQTYTYVWKTDKSWAGTCRQLIVRLSDGVDHIARFQFNGKARSADAEVEVMQQIFLPLVNR